MALVLTSGPAAEPISVAEAKAHLRIDGDSEDVLLASLVLTSRLHIEAALGLALITQGWRLVLDRWPKGGDLRIPLRPIAAVSEIRVRDAMGVATEVDADSYIADVESNPPRIVATTAGIPQSGRVAGGIEIDLVAGYGATADAVPAPIRHALLLLVAHWYEHRDPVEIGAPGAAIPDAVSRLLKPYRMARL
ncbi:MAG: head-tail connector protein [Hyphomicrobiaceae bacterium]|nr:head-tail connector protein [Hyphomicrobiaceae bacterium]